MKSYEEMAESVLQRRDTYVIVRKKRVKRMRSAGALACLCLIVLSGIGIWNSGLLRTPDPVADGASDKESLPLPGQGDVSSGIHNLSEQKNDISPGGANTGGRQETDSPGSEVQVSAGYWTDEETAADEHGGIYTEAPHTDHLTDSAAAYFCGSYTDENGAFVVVLTQDTPQSRDVVCRELGLDESKVTFKTGIYTLAYLTQLQEKISSAMLRKELPFVTSSAVMETSNCILVSVTTQEESSLALLKSLDTIGGAIEIEYTESGQSIENLLESITE